MRTPAAFVLFLSLSLFTARFPVGQARIQRHASRIVHIESCSAPSDNNKNKKKERKRLAGWPIRPKEREGKGRGEERRSSSRAAQTNDRRIIEHSLTSVPPAGLLVVDPTGDDNTAAGCGDGDDDDDNDDDNGDGLDEDARHVEPVLATGIDAIVDVIGPACDDRGSKASQQRTDERSAEDGSDGRPSRDVGDNDGEQAKGRADAGEDAPSRPLLTVVATAEEEGERPGELSCVIDREHTHDSMDESSGQSIDRSTGVFRFRLS